MENKPGPKPAIYTFGFMDESGLLHSPKEDRVFALGLLKIQNPANLHKEIIRYKTKIKYYSEFKFSEIRNNNIKMYKNLIDLYFSVPFTAFSCIVFDKTQLNITKFFKDNYFKAYNSFTGKLIAESLDTSEYITVLADDVNTPKSDKFEADVKHKVKIKTRRMALFGICRLESHAVSEIQMTDVLLGIVAYAFKLKYNLIKTNKRNAKYKIVEYLEKYLNIDTLSKSTDLKLRSGKRFSIKEFDGKLTKKIDSALGTTAT